MTLQTALLTVFLALVGIKEEPIGSNRGPTIDEANRVAQAPLGSPWCASIAKWGFLQIGIEDVPGAWSPDWGKKDHRIPAEQVQTGDQGVIWFNSLGRYGHTIACVETINRRGSKIISVTTLEGNTNRQGSREGDGFYRRVRPSGSVQFVRWLHDRDRAVRPADAEFRNLAWVKVHWPLSLYSTDAWLDTLLLHLAPWSYTYDMTQNKQVLIR